MTLKVSKHPSMDTSWAGQSKVSKPRPTPCTMLAKFIRISLIMMFPVQNRAVSRY